VLEKLLLFQVGTVAHRMPVDQTVAVPLDGGRLVVGWLIEQPGQSACGRRTVAMMLRADNGRLGERRRPLGGCAVLLHRHSHVRVLLGGDVVRAARQLRLLTSLPRAERGAGYQGARQKGQQTHQQRGTTRTHCTGTKTKRVNIILRTRRNTNYLSCSVCGW